MIETEYKFILDDKELDEVIKKLRELKFSKTSTKVYEKTIMFDNEREIMQKTNGRIRLRLVGEDKIEYSYKKPLPPIPGKPKKEIEYQVELSQDNLNQFIKIIHEMGFYETTSYERYRTEFEKDNIKVTVDEFPFTKILEIEGDEILITKLCKNLNINTKTHTNDACDTLFTKWRISKKLPPKDHMLFKDYDK